jgi:hypothetical protein
MMSGMGLSRLENTGNNSSYSLAGLVPNESMKFGTEGQKQLKIFSPTTQIT